MRLLTIFLLLFSLNPFAANANCGNKSDTFCSVKSVRVYDGDTFFVNISKLHSLFGTELGIRVKGIDTPELRGGSQFEKIMAKYAKNFTEDAVMNAKKVHLKNCTRGKYFRIVCNVEYDGKDLSQELIKAKLAVEYNK